MMKAENMPLPPQLTVSPGLLTPPPPPRPMNIEVGEASERARSPCKNYFIRKWPTILAVIGILTAIGFLVLIVWAAIAIHISQNKQSSESRNVLVGNENQQQPFMYPRMPPVLPRGGNRGPIKNPPINKINKQATKQRKHPMLAGKRAFI